MQTQYILQTWRAHGDSAYKYSQKLPFCAKCVTLAAHQRWVCWTESVSWTTRKEPARVDHLKRSHAHTYLRALLPAGEDILDQKNLPLYFHRCFTMESLYEAYRDRIYPATEQTLGCSESFVPVEASKPVKNKRFYERMRTNTERMTLPAGAGPRPPRRCSNCGSLCHTCRTCTLPLMSREDKLLFIARAIQAEEATSRLKPAPIPHHRDVEGELRTRDAQRDVIRNSLCRAGVICGHAPRRRG
jgi:hypothetical protein